MGANLGNLSNIGNFANIGKFAIFKKNVAPLPFTELELDAMEDYTFFSRRDILRIHKRFEALGPSLVMREKDGIITHEKQVPLADIITMAEFKDNPFRHRMGGIFAEDKVGGMTFQEFLEMFSIFSRNAPRDIKARSAFKIYDFDGDGFIGEADLKELLRCLTRGELTDNEADYICNQVFEEMHIDLDEQMTFNDFERVVSRAPDFLNTFCIRI